jgi:aminoglycoside 6'-N-acetyltransferase I
VTTIRRARSEDRAEWLRLRTALWSNAGAEELANEWDDALQAGEIAAFVAERLAGGLCGLLEAAIRPCTVNGELARIGYIEGWYVDADVRRQGVGRLLVSVAEEWARSQGCKEIHSDAELANELSHVAHQSLGYAEIGRLVHFRKSLL